MFKMTPQQYTHTIPKSNKGRSYSTLDASSNCSLTVKCTFLILDCHEIIILKKLSLTYLISIFSINGSGANAKNPWSVDGHQSSYGPAWQWITSMEKIPMAWKPTVRRKNRFEFRAKHFWKKNTRKMEKMINPWISRL